MMQHYLFEFSALRIGFFFANLRGLDAAFEGWNLNLDSMKILPRWMALPNPMDAKWKTADGSRKFGQGEMTR